MSAVVLIVARADNGVIGRDGALPWHLPADLKRFKSLTLGNGSGGQPMVMGRRTFESLPGLLPGRRHIVLTRDPDWTAAGAEVARDIDAALALAGERDVAVIGGAEVYAAFLPRATRIELTEIHAAPEGDTSLPPFDPDRWKAVARERREADGDRPAYSFVTLEPHD